MLLLLGLIGCACNPNLPLDDDVEPPDSDTGTETDTTTTEPEPPCAFPESEPNDTPAEADEVLAEERACGVIDDGDPADVFRVELDDDGWIEVEVEGDGGSVADVAFTFQGTGVAVAAKNTLESSDAWRVFAVPAGTYTLSVSEENGRGGPQYSYRALVSEVKPPAEWDSVEAEPNDSFAYAIPLTNGQVVLGQISDGGENDEDWFRIAVPAGRHDVHVRVDAQELGSGADTAVRVYEQDGAGVQLVERITDGGTGGSQPDPDGVYASLGDEVLWFEVSQQTEKAASIDRWYVLTVALEAR